MVTITIMSIIIIVALRFARICLLVSRFETIKIGFNMIVEATRFTTITLVIFSMVIVGLLQ